MVTIKKRCTAIFVIIAMVLSTIPAIAFAEETVPTSGSCGKNVTWEIAGDTFTLSGSGPMKIYLAERDMPWYNYDKSTINKVVIQDGITDIANYTFAGFKNVTQIEIPQSVTEIGNDAFNGCDNLTDINIPDKITTISCRMFSGCISLRSIVIPGSVTTIESYAFSYCTDLEQITIPKNVNSIDIGAFESCSSLSSVTMPENLPAIKMWTFKNCTSLKNINILSSQPDLIGKEAFYGCESLENIKLPPSVKTIETKAFYKCKKLTELIIPSNVTTIAAETFAECSGLTTVSLPDSLTNIETKAFYNCSSLQSIVIPSKVSLINDNAFYGCTALKTIHFKGDAPTIGSRAFYMVKATGLYPANGNGWAETVTNTYGGITWVPDSESGEDIPAKEITLTPNQITYIKEHQNFINSKEFDGYDNLMGRSTIEEDFLEVFGELKPDYEKWSAARFKIFENPYDQVISTMILSESSANAQLESFEQHLGAAQRSIINDITTLINDKKAPGEPEVNKDFVERILTAGSDSTDTNTYKMCQRILSGAVSDGTLEKVFIAYGTADAFLGVLGSTANVIDDVTETMNKVAVFSAYENTGEEFRKVLKDMADKASANGNKKLAKSLNEYVTISDKYDMAGKIAQTSMKGSAEIGKTLYKSSMEKKVSDFITSKVAQSGVSGLTNALSFLSGVKVGYDLTVTLDKLIIGTDDISDAYMYAYASADTLKTLGQLLPKYKNEVLNISSYNTDAYTKTLMFCKAFNMYAKQNVQTCKDVVSYFDEQLFSGSLNFTGDTAIEAAICQWNLRQLPWLGTTCHTDSAIISGGTTTIIDGKELDINVCSVAGAKLCSIRNGEIISQSPNVAGVVAADGKIYISLPSDQKYQIEISSATEQSVTKVIYSYNPDLKQQTVERNDSLQLKPENTTVIDVVIPVSAIKLNKTSGTLAINKTLQLMAEIIPSNAFSGKVLWSSSNTSVATVSNNGLVTAKYPGTAKIQCTSADGKITSACTITVPKLSQTISGYTSYTRTLGNPSFLLNARAQGKLKYSSSNKRVATVSTTGRVYIKGVGKATITVTAASTGKYNTKTKKVTITVRPKGVSLYSLKSPAKGKLTAGWRKNSTVSGYQLQYSKYSSFSKYSLITVKGYKTTKKTISKLSKKKYYYVRVRTYKIVNGTKYYSLWSNKKRVRTK